jgi:hypothetical protein
MSTELDRAVAALQARADTGRLPAASELRARGDHRRRVRVLGATVAVAAIVAGIALGAGVLRTLAVPNPAVTQHPTPSTGPTVGPEPTPTVEAYPTGSPIPMPAGCDEVYSFPYQGPARQGGVLPESNMLTAQDWGRCYAMVNDLGGYEVYEPQFGGSHPNICQNTEPYAEDEYRTAGRWRGFGAGPEIGGSEYLTQYEPGHAKAFMAEVRARVTACATFSPVEMPGEWHAKVIDTGFAGHESLLIYVGTSPTADPNGYPGWYIGVVRVGDLVAVVEPHFDLGGNRDHTLTMTKLAAGLL